MKVFIGAMESMPQVKAILEANVEIEYALISYAYIRRDKQQREYALEIRNRAKGVMVDSGAFSFQRGKGSPDFEEYAKEYADFIRWYDAPNVIGFMEMDVDNIIGYPRVLAMREVLHTASKKIIPVWHKSRGINDFIKMCEEQSGGWVAITGFKNEDIRDEQYLMFLKKAWEHNCKMHCLGMTRKDILSVIPFDGVDSSSWLQQAIRGKIGKRQVPKHESKTKYPEIMVASYLLALKQAKEYEFKWRKYEK